MYGSPQLLMLSGVGPAGHLREHGITVAADLPVGDNLHDHLFVPTRAGVVVVASDIDTEAGVAAVWLVDHVRGLEAVHEYCQFERIRGSWQYLGGGRGEGEFLSARRPSASRAGPATMMTSLSGSAGRSRSDREAQGDQWDFGRVGWVACAMFRVATEVAHLAVGARRIKVPRHGYIIVAWKAPPSSVSPSRPQIAAVGGDGRRLTELGPDDHLDSLTWASLPCLVRK